MRGSNANKIKDSTGWRIFNVCNIAFMIFLSLIMAYPVWHVLMASFSNAGMLMAHRGPLFVPAGFSYSHDTAGLSQYIDNRNRRYDAQHTYDNMQRILPVAPQPSNYQIRDYVHNVYDVLLGRNDTRIP
jgi:ABC-type glycerol-3-phosphate transport system permease component